MATRLPNQAELKYVPVPDDLDIIAQVVRLVTLEGNTLHIEALWLEQVPGFEIPESAGRSVNGEFDRQESRRDLV